MTKPRRFHNERQEARARHLAAYGPLGRVDIDDELDALGWTERYDGDPYSTDLTDTAARAMFDHLGHLVECFAPQEE
jgi:hypothetical protein